MLKHVALCIVVPLVGSSVVWADTFTWQGGLVDGGAPADGVYDFKFRLYDSAAGPAQIGPENVVDDVTVTNGMVTVELDFLAGAFPGADRWLETDVKADTDVTYTTLAPRQALHPTPYAFHAATSSMTNDGGLPAAYTAPINFANGTNSFTGSFFGSGTGLGGLNATNISSGTMDDARLSSNVALQGALNTFTGNIQTIQSFNPILRIWSTGTNGWLRFHDSAGTWEGYVGYDHNLNELQIGNKAALVEQIVLDIEGDTSFPGDVTLTNGRIGIGTAAPGYPLHVQQGAGSGWAAFPFQYAVVGDAASGPGVVGVTNSSNAAGVVGISLTASGDAPGVVGMASSPNTSAGDFVNDVGIGVEGKSDVGTGVWGETDSGTGVIGEANTTGDGVFGDSFDGYGVRARSWNETAIYGEGGDVGVEGVGGNGPGVVGAASGPWPAVLGTNFDAAGGSGISGQGGSVGVKGQGVDYGVRGESGGVAVYGDGGSVGVQGQSSGTAVRAVGLSAGLGLHASSSAIAIQCDGICEIDGDCNISGTLSKGGGAFRIDHPLDPENKELWHSFVESPDMINIYNGIAVLDDFGRAVVELPDYFEALNRDFRYQLTPIGAPMRNLYIASKVSDNRFEIAGGKPGMEVSWEVTGVRQDPFAEANRIPTEVAKRPEDRGTYLHPTAWGQPEAKGVYSSTGEWPATSE